MSAMAMQYFDRVDAATVAAVLQQWRKAHPAMGVLALLPEGEKEQVGTLQRVCTQLNVPLVGAVFPALVEQGVFRSNGVWLLRFDAMPYAALYENVPTDPASLTALLDTFTDGIKPHINTHKDSTLFLLFDAMVPNIGTMLDELYLRLANRVHYMGANAGSETFQPMPCLFDGTRIVSNGVLALLLKPHRGAILEHGYSVPQRMITATSTVGNRIQQIDWRPAFEVYQEMARAQYGVEVTRENFYQVAVHFPVGIVRANGVILVRIPVALEEDGSLFCVGEVAPNSMLTLLQAPAVDSVHTLDTLLSGLSGLYGDLSMRDLLLFYCAGRRLHLGVAAAGDELRGLEQRTAGARIAGALSLGEIGSTTQWGYPLFHNATLVASVWGEN
jgi:hypothetical protein